MRLPGVTPVDIAFFIRGLAVGFSIAAPVGPIGVLCIRRTLTQGSVSGFVSGLGAATADALYGLIAAFGLTSIATFFAGQQFWLRAIGGGFLVYLGSRIFFAKPGEQANSVQDGPATRDREANHAGVYVSTLFLTLTNPMTILSFAAVFAGMGLGSRSRDFSSAGLLVLGVFLGSTLWWAVLSSAAGAFRSRVSPRGLRWVNRVSAAIIGGFGVAVLAGAIR